MYITQNKHVLLKVLFLKLLLYSVYKIILNNNLLSDKGQKMLVCVMITATKKW